MTREPSLTLSLGRSGRIATAVCIALLSLLLEGCAKEPVPEPVTLTLLEEWTTSSFGQGRRRELEQFTRETGVRVELLPSPESARDKLVLWQQVLATGAGGPDVFGIDVIWPRILTEYFIDLRPYFANEIAQQFPVLAASYTVDGKVVAIPYRADVGLLYYRTDLLRRYGYRAPPSTWDELEAMAARIQAGERARGNSDFWGFVWQGSVSEGLTCNALEWQAAVGGGRIIEDDKTISVNNPRAIRAWQRAARWVGSISPPSVVRYTEWDAINLFVAGDAAFMRNWPTAYVDSYAAESPVRDRFAVELLPGGEGGHLGTLGGAGLAVSRFSAHPREAIALARYLSRADVQENRSRVLSVPPTLPSLYERPDVIARYPFYEQLNRAFRSGLVSRPSNVTGKRYQAVSDAYMQVVHSVLTGSRSAPDAAAALETELVRITGFRTGPPTIPSSIQAGRPLAVWKPGSRR